MPKRERDKLVEAATSETTEPKAISVFTAVRLFGKAIDPAHRQKLIEAGIEAAKRKEDSEARIIIGELIRHGF